jgi:hypothetical protein
MEKIYAKNFSAIQLLIFLLIVSVFIGLFLVNFAAFNFNNGGGPTSTTSPPNDRFDSYALCQASIIQPRSIGVMTQDANHAWSASVTSGNSWITLTGATSFVGSGFVSYVVTPNTGSTSRFGTILIDGQNYSIEQLAYAGETTCPFDVDPPQIIANKSGGSFQLNVSSRENSQDWRIAISENDTSWIRASANYDASIANVNIAPNFGAAKITSIIIAGRNIPIIQEGKIK